jgi:hypothetical protein
MTDRQVPIDIAAVALRQVELEGEQRLLSQGVKNSLDAFRSTMDNVQLEVRHMSSRLETLAEVTAQQATTQESVNHLNNTLSDLRSSFETMIKEIVQGQERRWEAHERDNRETRDQVIRWGGIGFAVMLMGGFIVSGFVAFQQMQFTQFGKEIAQTGKASADMQTAFMERANQNSAAINATAASVRDIELYLARGGGIPSTPYQPKGQAK